MTIPSIEALERITLEEMILRRLTNGPSFISWGMHIRNGIVSENVIDLDMDKKSWHFSGDVQSFVENFPREVAKHGYRFSKCILKQDHIACYVAIDEVEYLKFVGE